MNSPVFVAFLAAASVFFFVSGFGGRFSLNRRRAVARAVYHTNLALASNPYKSQISGEQPQEAGRRRSVLRQSRLGNGVLGRLLVGSRWAARRAELLEQAEIHVKVSQYVVGVIVISVVMMVVASSLSGLPVVGFAFLLIVPFMADRYIKGKIKKRTRKFESQLAVAVQSMATSLKAGFGIMESFNTISTEMEKPISVEFRRVLDEARAGGSFEAGLDKMTERVNSKDLRIVVRAMELHRRVGGNLSEILEVVASTMREREELRGHTMALTAQQRMGGTIVGLLPAWIVVFFLFTNPDFISPLWTVPAGRIMLGAGITLEAFAYVIMNKVLAIEV